MKLYVVNKSGKPVPRRFLENWVKRLERELADDVDLSGYRKKEIGLIFLNAREARELNKTYRGKNYATDVLSFEGDTETSLGELVICPEVIRRQAEEHGLLYREELGYMVIHGLLHLLGFQHEKGGREAKRMYELQDRVFEHLCRQFETVRRKDSRSSAARRSRRSV